MTNWLWIGSATLLCFQWIVIHLSGAHPSPEWQSLSSGLAIFGAAFILSWAAELAQLDIPQALAIALLALIAVLPEYAVDMYFAWRAGHDPSYTPWATANMTGSNRLLIGLGWPAVLLGYWWGTRKKEIVLEPGHKVEFRALLLATVYCFVIPIKRTLSLVDFALLFVLFLVYMRGAMKSEVEEPELEGVTETIARLGV